MSLKSLFFAASTTLVLAAGAWAGDADLVVIEDAYARVSSPNAKVGASFLEIENHGAEDDRLIDAKSDVAARAELHTHKESDGGIMQMLHVPEGFSVPAGGTHALKRGGDHVMLMGLRHGLVEGDEVRLELVFEKAGSIEINVPVDLHRKPDADAHGGHQRGTHTN